MAKQKGIIPLVGTIGGINFYYLNGKPVARKAGGGFNGKAIRTKASMQRVRENGIEFGHCSKVNRAFRLALKSFYTGRRFTHFHSRLMTLFTALKDLDAINARGKRVVDEGAHTVEGLAMLEQFNYTPSCDVGNILPFEKAIHPSTFNLTISGFDITKVKFITGATHLELNYGVLDFNFATLKHALYMALPFVLDRDFAGTTLTLVTDALNNPTDSRLCILGVRFYQEVDGVGYELHAENGVGMTVLSALAAN